MLRILALIYRFDFEPSYDMIDRPGSVMRVLSNTPGDYWTDIGENRATRDIVGEHKEADRACYGSIHFEPTSLNGHFEHGAGLAFDAPPISKFLDAVGHCATEVFGMFDIGNFARAGARFQLLSGATDLPLDPSDAMRALFARRGSKLPSSFVRDTRDFRITLEGAMESAVSFKISAGPGALSDYEKFLRDGRVKISRPTDRHELTADIDLYERSVHIPGSRIQKWITTKFDIVEQFLPDLSAMVLRR